MARHRVRSRRTSRTWVRVFLASIFLVGGTTRVGAGEPAERLNSCGCRQNSAGVCYCDPKSKCGCPGECEPKGCAEKRDRQFKKEIDEETRRAKVGEAKQPSQEHEVRAVAEAPTHARVVPRLSAPERRSLGRLLDRYIAEHPETGARTVDELRASLLAVGLGEASGR
jgi:hypothetical protein